MSKKSKGAWGCAIGCALLLLIPVALVLVARSPWGRASTRVREQEQIEAARAAAEDRAERAAIRANTDAGSPPEPEPRDASYYRQRYQRECQWFRDLEPWQRTEAYRRRRAVLVARETGVTPRVAYLQVRIREATCVELREGRDPG